MPQTLIIEEVHAKLDLPKVQLPDYDVITDEEYDIAVSQAETERTLEEILAFGLTCAELCKEDHYGGLTDPKRKEAFRERLETVGIDGKQKAMIADIIRSKKELNNTTLLLSQNAIPAETTADAAKLLTRVYFHLGIVMLEPSNEAALMEEFPYHMGNFSIEDASAVIEKYAQGARAMSTAYHNMDQLAKSRVEPVVAG